MRDKVTLKVQEFINFIIPIIIKSFTAAVGKMPEKHWVEFGTVHHRRIKKKLPL